MDIPKNTVPMSEIVRDNFARFDFYRNGNAFYRITVRGIDYNFPVRLDMLDGASLFATEKAITLMKYIKKAFQDETFVRAS